MKYYLFPKCFQNMPVDVMMQKTAEMGFDGPTALVREGFPLEKDNLKTALPAYVKAANDCGLEVKYGSADLALDGWGNAWQGEMLKCLADNGVEAVRMQHRVKNPLNDDIRTLYDELRRGAEMTAKAAEEAKIRCVIQIHGTCYPHNASTAYACVKDLDPRYIGVKIDPGNNVCQEGYELFYYQIGLLREYIAVMGAKDGVWTQTGDLFSDNKGWCAAFAPAYEGMTDFPDIFRLLRRYNIDIPAVLMPFYGANNDDELFSKIQRELEYFKTIEKSIQ